MVKECSQTNRSEINLETSHEEVIPDALRSATIAYAAHQLTNKEKLLHLLIM